MMRALIPQTVVADVYPTWLIDLLKVWGGFALATIIALIVYIWRERTVEKAIEALSTEFQKDLGAVEARTSALERSVDGYQGKGGLQHNVRGLRKAVRWSNTAVKAIARR